MIKKQFVDLARKLADKSTHFQHHLGCVLVRRNRVISVGWNSLKTHPAAKTHDHYLHAELHCIIGVDRRLTEGCTLYICRVRHNGDFGMAKPCEICHAALKLAGVKKIVYSNTDGKIIEEKLGEFYETV